MHNDIPDTQDLPEPDAWPPASAWRTRVPASSDALRYTPDDDRFYRRALGLAFLFEHRQIPLRPRQEDVLIQLIALQEADAGAGSLLPTVVQGLLEIAAWPCWDRDLAALADELGGDVTDGPRP
jgi:hypothetical protein